MSDAGLDAYSRRLRQAHDTGVLQPGPRAEITESWRRSVQAGVDVESRAAPLVFELDVIADVRRSHPLDPVLPMLTQALRRVADESAHIMIVADEAGRILWRDGHRATLRAADRVGLADGHMWSESCVGTNGLGSALATRKPFHVYSEEHLMRVLHIWSCSGAPIVDPDTDAVIGCIDLSATSRTLPPSSVALVGMAARLAEAELALRMHRRDERLRAHYDALPGRPGVLVSASGRIVAGDSPGLLGRRLSPPGPAGYATLPDGRMGLLEPFHGGYLLHVPRVAERQVLRLAFLGDGPPSAYLGDRAIPLTLRHAEILALLALHPHGLTAEQLSFLLYGDAGNPATIRAEIHRLRAQLGGMVGAKPYRLAAPVDADFLTVKRLVAAGDAAAAARAYGGPLLPRSESPEIRREREELEAQVRTCLLRHGSADDLWGYAQTVNGREDFQVLERLSRSLPPTDHRAVTARARLTSA
ncbi:helix-turn-helix domain-containing protein [Thermoactinospora rubra]|uniref:helix-turn-helix domain-containing protein n=1 Tax=Thermoactinospora rubra TaxID=1088767 RepID=UPI000A1078B1|nr:helix-turn-helix domain-containing protein [Thermoactinospora rubra]